MGPLGSLESPLSSWRAWKGTMISFQTPFWWLGKEEQWVLAESVGPSPFIPREHGWLTHQLKVDQMPSSRLPWQTLNFR